MSRFKRSTISVTSIVAAAVLLAVVASNASDRPSLLRVHAAAFGIDQLTVAPRAELIAKADVNVSVSFVCQSETDSITGQPLVVFNGGVFVIAFEKIRGGGATSSARDANIVFASGRGEAGSSTIICDEGLTPNPVVNHITVLVTPEVFPFSVPVPFRHGTAEVLVDVSACSLTFVASGVPPPCEFGHVDATDISIK